MSTGTLILAFDGLVADTIPIRAEALQQALAQWTEDSTTGPTLERWSAALPGRSLLEAAEQVLGTGDPTRTELVAHRAAQLASDAVRRGVRLTEGIDAFLGAQRTAGVLCVLRADSPRRDVEHVLGMTGLDTAFTIVRCADDPPADHRRSSLENAYVAITARLDARRVSGARQALEVSEHAAAVARQFTGSARTGTVLPG